MIKYFCDFCGLEIVLTEEQDYGPGFSIKYDNATDDQKEDKSVEYGACRPCVDKVFQAVKNCVGTT